MIAAATPPRDINTTMDGSREPNCPLAVGCTGGTPNPLSAHAWESPWSLLRAGGFLFRLEPNPSVDDYWAGRAPLSAQCHEMTTSPGRYAGAFFVCRTPWPQWLNRNWGQANRGLTAIGKSLTL